MQHPTDFTGALRILATALLRADIATQQRFVEAETEYTVTETGNGLVINGIKIHGFCKAGKQGMRFLKLRDSHVHNRHPMANARALLRFCRHKLVL